MGCSSPSGLANPSTVISSVPSACTASMMHDRTASPSIRIVHAPHTPCSQPTCVPVRSHSSRKKSTSVFRTSMVPSYSVPFTRRRIVRVVAITPEILRGVRSGAPRHHGLHVARRARLRQMLLEGAVDVPVLILVLNLQAALLDAYIGLEGVAAECSAGVVALAAPPQRQVA